MSKKKATILNWSAGVTTSNRAATIEEFNSGFSSVKNFDIYSDPKVIKPVGEFERWNTEGEEQYQFKGIGVNSTTVYATGRADSSWYGNFSYRVKITPDFYDTKYLAFSLANMPANFWTVMSTGATEIRVINQDGGFVAKDTIRFNTTTKAGFLVFAVQPTDEYFYIYYGNTTIDTIVEGLNTSLDRSQVYSGASLAHAYIFDSVANGYPMDREETITDNDSLDEGSIGTYKVGGTGHIGYALKGGTYFNDEDQPNIANDDNTSVAFTIELGSSYAGVSGRVATVGSYFEINVNSSGKVVFFYDNTSELGNTITSTASLTLNAVNRVVCTYQKGQFAKIYINGVLDTTDNTRVQDDIDDGGWWIEWIVGSETIADVMYSRVAYSTDMALHEYNMLLSNASYYVIAAEESKPSLPQLSGGLSLYQKELSDTSWKLVEGVVPVSSLDYTPVVSPVLVFNSSAMTFFTAEGTVAVCNQSLVGGVNFDNYFGLSFNQPTSGNLMVAVQGIDDKFYVGNGSSTLHRFTPTQGDSGVFDSYPIVKGVEDSSGFIVVVGNYSGGDKSFMQIWDRAASTSQQSVNVGLGEAQILGNLKGTLFVVVNNFIDDENKSIQTQSMDVRVYIGGGDMKTTHRISVPTTMEGFYTNEWDKPVSQLKCTTKNAVLFYAKIPNDASGYDEGLWALGKNEITDEIGLSLLYETSELGHVYNVASIGNQIVLFHNDDKVSRLALNPLYNKTSVARTKVFNDGNSQKDKQLSGVEIVHEDITGNQVISVYKKNEIDTDWVLILQSTASNQESIMSYETTVDVNGDALGNFKEIEFKIESIGGAAGITQLAMNYETLSDNV